MNHRKLRQVAVASAFVVASIVGFSRVPQSAPKVTFTPFHANAMYKAGEKVGWTVRLVEGSTPPTGKYTYTIKKNNFESLQSGELDLASGPKTIEITVSDPEMLYVQVTPPTIGGIAPPRDPRGFVAAAAVEPTMLKPVAPRPKDFDDFWKAKIDALNKVPMNPVLTPKDGGRPEIEYSTIVLDHVDGGHIQGQFAKPKTPGKHPAMLQLQWASPPYPLDKNWINGYAAQGWIVLNIEPHDVIPDAPREYYAALPAELKNYTSIGVEDRDKSYFVKMYLADYRAVDFLASQPDWDGKTLVVTGTSMGGHQSLAVAGLHPKVTHALVNVPSGCDLNASLNGRQMGYPNFPSNNPKAMATAQYVDVVNFAPHIKARTLVAMGFVDTVSPPAGIWTAFNQIPGPKEAAPMPESPHNNTATRAQQMPWTSRSSAWLNALLKGDPIPPAPSDVEK